MMGHASGAGAARSTWLGTPSVATAMRCGAARSHAMFSPLLRCGSRGLRERGPPAGVFGVDCFRTNRFIPRRPPDANPKHIPQPAPAQSSHSRHTTAAHTSIYQISHDPRSRHNAATVRNTKLRAATPTAPPALSFPPFAPFPAVRYNSRTAMPTPLLPHPSIGWSTVMHHARPCFAIRQSH